MQNQYDFSGWATKNNLLCTDGRVIMENAFKHNDGKWVPLVWNHSYGDPDNVLGKAKLENRPEGVYAYGYFNETESAKAAKELLRHGDIQSLSIFANKLKHDGHNVVHGDIKEVSLVLASANPGAYIEDVMCHGESQGDSVILCVGDDLELYHSEDNDNKKEEPLMKEEQLKHAEDDQNDQNEQQDDESVTVQDVLDSMNEEQLNVVYALLADAAGASDEDDEEDNEENEGDEDTMKHNAFENDFNESNTLSHSEFQTIMNDMKRYGSLSESVLAHADEYGIENIEYLFPEDRNIDSQPQFISRDMGWVSKVMSGVHHTPFSRVKSMFADITEEQARAKGYIKGNLKKEEVFSLLRRSTSPTTVYKKQKIDRDDQIDITDFDVLAWLKSEMRMMLDEELARAFLIGDGRLGSDLDKIDENRIRPIVNDASLFVIRWGVSGSTEDDKAKNFIKAAIKARKSYKGSGSPTLFTTDDMLTDMLLLEDGIGHSLYKTEAELATKLRVKEIVTVPVLENFTDKDGKVVDGIIVNLDDYNVGADKGGSINMFEDFDIDYNQEKYLIETRCSGALTKPFSAIVLRESDATADESGVVSID